MLKQTISVLGAALLTALLLLQLQGPWLVFKLQQRAIRSEVKKQLKAGVPEEDLVTLRIARVWEEQGSPRFRRMHSKEFRFDGEMYDIVYTEVHTDTTYYTCIHDVRESGLFARLDEMTEENIHQPANTDSRNRIIQWLSLEYCISDVTMPRANSDFAVLTPFCSVHYSSVLRDRHSPPPELFRFDT